MAAAERLQVGAVGEGDLDLDEHVARPRLRVAARPRGGGRPARGSEEPSRREDDLQRPAGAVALEPFGEAVERQHVGLRQVELREERQRRLACAAASPSASRSASARGGRRRRGRPARRGRRRARSRPARRRRAALRERRGRRRRRGRRARGPLAPAARPFAKTSSPRCRSTAAKSRPTNPCPTTSTRPRGTRSAPRSTQASGSRYVPSASSIPSGSSIPSAAADLPPRSRPGTIVGSAKRSQVDSWPARQRSHSPQGRWWISATRAPSARRATTSCPSTVPAGARRRSSPRPSRRARTRARAWRRPARATSASRGCPSASSTTARTAAS